MEHTYSARAFGKLIGKSVNTLHKWDRKGILKAYHSPTNRRSYTHKHYLLYRGFISCEYGKTNAYACVSSPAQKRDLTTHKEALRVYCVDHGIKVDQWEEDVGSALNHKRRGFNQVIQGIQPGQVKRLVIGYEDRFVLFGQDWFEAFCELHGIEIVVTNGESFSPEQELLKDMQTLVTVFSARLHGWCSHKNAMRGAALEKEVKHDQGTQNQIESNA